MPHHSCQAPVGSGLGNRCVEQGGGRSISYLRGPGFVTWGFWGRPGSPPPAQTQRSELSIRSLPLLSGVDLPLTANLVSTRIGDPKRLWKAETEFKDMGMGMDYCLRKTQEALARLEG